MFFWGHYTSYSPELNPVERFYGKVRKSTANRLFKDIEIQESIIENEVVVWMANRQKTQKLCGYDWIIEQAKSFIFQWGLVLHIFPLQ